VRFTKDRRGLRADPDELEAGLLRRLAEDLQVLLGDEPEDPSDDPLEALLGTAGADAALPEDPALARLLPDAYTDDDPGASREFRRYTEGDLRAGKRAHATTVLTTLAAAGTGRLTLDRDEADAWLGCLNDLRLVLGTRLEVTEDLDPDDMDEDDPRAQALAVYGWLGWLQESLLSVLLPRG
jgi:hypothetical protein